MGNETHRKYGALSSSSNPQEIANTVKGVIVALSSVIIFIAASVFNITLNASDVLGIAADIGIGAGAIWTIYGLLMKLIVRFAKQ